MAYRQLEMEEMMQLIRAGLDDGSIEEPPNRRCYHGDYHHGPRLLSTLPAVSHSVSVVGAANPVSIADADCWDSPSWVLDFPDTQRAKGR